MFANIQENLTPHPVGRTLLLKKKKMEFSDVRVFIVETGLWTYFLAQKLE